MADADDPWHLQRFVDAQRGVYARVREELAAGRKRSHWMWFVFPQVEGLGRSEMARRYAIASADEACAYLAHPMLGPRLRECAALVLAAPGPAIDDVLGPPDDLKFKSCMTLFDAAAPSERVFADNLDRFFGGARDAATLARP